MLSTLLQVKEITICYLFLDLKMAHEQQKKSLEEEFKKNRLSLQVNQFNSLKMYTLTQFVGSASS